ncbi:MAG: hypothetical protein R3F14_12550 [Polyangiaceae bacterium]
MRRRERRSQGADCHPQALAEKLAAELTALQAEAEKAPPASIREKVERSAEASFAIALDEQATRRLIDAQLREAGWEADSGERLTFQRGARPEKGANRAIAEWPTGWMGRRGERIMRCSWGSSRWG